MYVQIYKYIQYTIHAFIKAESNSVPCQVPAFHRIKKEGKYSASPPPARTSTPECGRRRERRVSLANIKKKSCNTQ